MEYLVLSIVSIVSIVSTVSTEILELGRNLIKKAAANFFTAAIKKQLPNTQYSILNTQYPILFTLSVSSSLYP